MGTFQVLMMIVAFIMFGLLINVQMVTNANEFQRKSETETIDNMYSVYKLANQYYDSTSTFDNYCIPVYAANFPYGSLSIASSNGDRLQIVGTDLSGQQWLANFTRNETFSVVKI